MIRNTFTLVKKYIHLAFILSFFALTLACEQTTICTTSNTSLAKVAFFKIAETRQADTLYGVSVVTENNILLYEPDTVIEVILPVNPAATSTNFLFIRDNKTDTLQLSYEIEQIFTSSECGFDQRFFNLNVPNTSFDSVRIRSNELVADNNNDTNIEIYRCVNENTASIIAEFVQNVSGEKVQDTIFYNRVNDDKGNVLFTDAALSVFRLPVNPDEKRVQYFFHRLSNGSPDIDTLTVNYARFQEQLARMCPVQTRYDTLRVDRTYTSFDSTTVLKRHLNKINSDPNIEIFFTL